MGWKNVKLDAATQNFWLVQHILHRVRAAVARLHGMEGSVLRASVKCVFLDEPSTGDSDQRIAWRCTNDAVHEGRLAATRWLIEFVGIKWNGGSPIEAEPDRSKDVRIDQIDGGSLISHGSPEGMRLGQFWKGCSQAMSHATDSTRHPPVDEATLAAVLTIITAHLDSTIYKAAKLGLRELVLAPAQD